MKIEVRLFAHLREKGQSLLFVEFDDGKTIRDLIKTLGLDNEPSLIIMVNGKRQLENFELKDGDRVGIFPPVGGG